MTAGRAGSAGPSVATAPRLDRPCGRSCSSLRSSSAQHHDQSLLPTTVDQRRCRAFDANQIFPTLRQLRAARLASPTQKGASEPSER